MNGSSFPTRTVGADRIRPKLTKLNGWMNGKSVWLLPLGFPRGEAAERSEADEGWRQVGQ